jgi:hypothetical protein
VSDARLPGLPDPATEPVKVVDPDSTVSRADPAGTGGEAQANIEGAPSTAGGADPSALLPKASREDAPLMQFPSVAGQSGVEVAERSSDVTTGRTRNHRKVFRVFFGPGDAYIPETFDHGPNRVATRQYMTSHGLRPIGEVELVSAEPYDDNNIDLTYQVEAVPAAIAVEPATAHVVVSTD